MADERIGWVDANGWTLPPVRVTASRGSEPAAPRIHRRIVEALLEGLREHPGPRSVVAQALERASDEATLPLSDFHRLMSEVASRVSPEDPWDAGYRLAGNAFSEGWARHPCGRVFVDGLRRIPLARAVVRIVDGLRFGAEGLELEAVLLGANRMRLILRGSPAPQTVFFCGCMEGMLRLLGAVHPLAQPEPSAPGTQGLLISWEPPDD